MEFRKLERKAKQSSWNWNSPLEQSRVQSRGMSSRGGVCRERRSVQVVCQSAEERKASNGARGGEKEGGGRKNKKNPPLTVNQQLCVSVWGESRRRDRAGGASSESPLKAREEAAVRGRTSAGVVLTSPAAESD